MNLDELLEQARSSIERVQPADLSGEFADGALVVDIRPVDQRTRDGELTGAVVIDRNVLEWRLAIDSAWKIPEVAGPDQRIVLVCNEGYASSLAAATMRALGMDNVCDLAEGVQGLIAAGLAPATVLTGRR